MYLVLTLNLGLWYPKGLHFELIGYSDADYAGCKVDRKSITRLLPITYFTKHSHSTVLIHRGGKKVFL
jgi:hypothetical protein